jgi:hypothetical protein
MTMSGAVLQLTCENYFFTQCENADTNNNNDDEDDDDGYCNIDHAGGDDVVCICLNAGI